MNNESFLRVPALTVEQPIGTFYVATIRASDLLEVCFTDRLRAVPASDGYRLEGTQREKIEKRLRDIGKFISQDDVAFPNSIILAANYREEDGSTELDEELRWRVEFERERGCGELIIPTKNKLAAVIDGQHRLFGFTEANRGRRDMQLICSVFLDLPRPFQAYMFATINSTQKAVDRSQTYELFGYNLDKEPEAQWSPDKLSVFFARKLNTERGSPFNSRILVSAQSDHLISRSAAKQQGKWVVSMATVVDGISSLISTNSKEDARLLATNRDKASRKDLEKARSTDRAPLRELYLQSLDSVLYSAVKNFFSAAFGVQKTSGDELSSYLTKTVGIQALFDVFRRISTTALEKKDFSEEYFREILLPLEEIDFSNEHFKQASGQGRALIRDAILMKIGQAGDLKPERTKEIEGLFDALQ